LVESEKMAALGNLVAGIAHEINTPVGVGITAASALENKTRHIEKLFNTNTIKRSDLQTFLQFLDKSSQLILSNLQRTGELVQSFKQVSVDQSYEQLRHFKIKSYIQDVLRSLEPKLKDKSIDIIINCSETIELNSYPGSIAQIITNLILNSYIHGFRDTNEGTVKIAAKLQNDNLVINYQDTGKGIPDNILPKIFDPFFTTDNQSGTGLGLHIIYNIITQQLKGTISCESKPGEGVDFTIVIPQNIREING